MTTKYIDTLSDAGGRQSPKLMFSSMTNVINDINTYISFGNYYISPFYFKDFEAKKTAEGSFIRYGPKYSTAIIENLFFDIDCYRKDGTFIQASYDSMKKLWGWAKKNDIKIEVAHTSGGYQVLVKCKNVTAKNYKDVMYDICTSLDLSVDWAANNLAIMKRVIGSYNFGKDKKSARNTFVTSLTRWEIEGSYAKHLEATKKRRKKEYWHGSDYYIPPKTLKVKNRSKIELEKNTEFKVNTSLSDMLETYGLSYEYDFCQNIKDLIEQRHVSHVHRIYVLTYLKDILNISYGDVLKMLPKLLSSPHGNSTDGGHSIMEGQPEAVYASKYSFSPKYMKMEGICDHNCTQCEDYIKEMRRIK